MGDHRVIVPAIGHMFSIVPVSRSGTHSFVVDLEKGKNVFMFLKYPKMEASGICPMLVPGIELTFEKEVTLKKKNGHAIAGRVALLERGQHEGQPDWVLRFRTGAVCMQELKSEQMVTITAFPERPVRSVQD